VTRRVVVSLALTSAGWDTTVDGATRSVPTVTAPLFGPLPVPADATLAPADLATMLDRLDRNDPKDGDAAAVGQHLLACLFDDATWTALCDGGDDLQLVLATAAPELHRLPWELLHDGTGFLAARTAPAVTINRVVGRPAAATRPVQIEPVVLVVVGGAFDEAGLQPAAEYLALLDTLRQGELALHAHLVVNATTDDLAAACAQLQPDVVHVIAHGEQRRDGTGYVELVPSRRGDRPTQVTAQQLLTLLGAADRLPRVLILTACRSASVGAAAGRPTAEPFTFQPSLAAACVHGGVPIVSAMTGAITSRACREFTLGFYGALLRGGDALEAAASGRRSAFVASGPSARAVDWAYPVVFCGSDFDGRVEVAQAAVLAGRATRARELVDQFRSPLTFCGRHDVLDGFRRLLAPPTSAGYGVLALCVPKDIAPKTRIGASRTLAQLGASAVLAGWAVAARTVGDDEAQSFRKLAGQLIGAARRAGTALGAAVPPTTQWRLLEQDPQSPALHPELRDLFDYDQVAPDSEQAIRKALVLDLTAVRRAVLTAPSPGRGLVVLIDDLHGCGPGVAPLLFGATGYGLGTAADPVPLVFSYREGHDDKGSGAVESVVAFVQQGRARRIEVTPFLPPSAALAYQQLLLGASPPLVPVAAHRDTVLNRIHKASQGRPDLFAEDAVSSAIETFLDMAGVEPATDPQRLAALLGRQP
jgi:hypothetical protein